MVGTRTLRRLTATLLLTGIVAVGVSGCIAVPYGGYGYGGTGHHRYAHHPYGGWRYDHRG
jgi:hypothetical protein